MKKRGVCMLAALLSGSIMLSGCGVGGKAALFGNGQQEYITVDVYDELANYQGVQSGWFAEEVKKRFHMELNIIAPNVSGGGSLYQTLAAAGKLGDLVIVDTSNGKVKDMVDFGLITDCSEWMEGKDILKNYGKAVKKANEGLSQDADDIFVFPNSISERPSTEPSEGTEPTFGPYIRWDYYGKLGYPRMQNLGDFLDVLEQMQDLARGEEGADDIYAISLFRDWDDNMMNNAKQLACMYGYDEMGFVLAKADGSDYQDILEDGSVYQKTLRFLFEANQRGLLDPASGSQDYTSWTSKYRDGKVLYCPWPWVGQSEYNTPEHRADGKGFMLAAVEDMQIFSFGNCPEGNMENVIAIGSGAKDPQRLADFIDWLYSPEGMELNCQANGAAGIRGLTWEINEDGKALLTEFGKSALPGNDVPMPEEYGEESWQDGISALNFRPIAIGDPDPATGEAYDYTRWETTVAASDTALDRDWKAHMHADTTMEYLSEAGMLLIAPGSDYMTPKDEADIMTMRSLCKTAVVEESWQMAFAEDEAKFLRLWEELRITADGMGYQEVLAVDRKNAADQDAARKRTAKLQQSE